MFLGKISEFGLCYAGALTVDKLHLQHSIQAVQLRRVACQIHLPGSFPTRTFERLRIATCKSSAEGALNSETAGMWTLGSGSSSTFRPDGARGKSALVSHSLKNSEGITSACAAGVASDCWKVGQIGQRGLGPYCRRAYSSGCPLSAASVSALIHRGCDEAHSQCEQNQTRQELLRKYG